MLDHGDGIDHIVRLVLPVLKRGIVNPESSAFRAFARLRSQFDAFKFSIGQALLQGFQEVAAARAYFQTSSRGSEALGGKHFDDPLGKDFASRHGPVGNIEQVIMKPARVRFLVVRIKIHAETLGAAHESADRALDLDERLLDYPAIRKHRSIQIGSEDSVRILIAAEIAASKAFKS